MEFRQGKRVMKVNETAYGEKAGAERVVFRGTISGKPYLFDVVTIPAMAGPGFVSRTGWRLPSDNMPVRWGAKPKRWHDGMRLDIYTGPLPGAWDAVCRR